MIAANFSASSASPFIKGNRQPFPSSASIIFITFHMTDKINKQAFNKEQEKSQMKSFKVPPLKGAFEDLALSVSFVQSEVEYQLENAFEAANKKRKNDILLN